MIKANQKLDNIFIDAIQLTMPEEIIFEFANNIRQLSPFWNLEIESNSLLIFNPQNSCEQILEELSNIWPQLTKNNKFSELIYNPIKSNTRLKSFANFKLKNFKLSFEDSCREKFLIKIPANYYLDSFQLGNELLTFEAIINYLKPIPGRIMPNPYSCLIIEQGKSLSSVAINFISENANVEAITESLQEETFLKNLSTINNCKISTLCGQIEQVLNKFQDEWVEKFNLILIRKSPQVTTKILKQLTSFLNPENHSLIISGFSSSNQGAYLLKNAFNSGLVLQSSSNQELSCLMNLELVPKKLPTLF